MKSYIINLNRSPDRWKFMQEQFNMINQDLPVIRVPAVDGMSLSEETIATHYAPELTYKFLLRTSPLSKGEIACFLSHRKCWELILKGDDEYGAIFEDDVILSSSLDKFLGNENWVPETADIIKLEKAANYVWVATQTSLSQGKHTLYQFFSDNLCCGGYIISRRTAATLLSLTTRFSLPVDHVVFDDRFPFFNLFNVWLVSPAVCIQFSVLEEDKKKFSKERNEIQNMSKWMQENIPISMSTLEEQRKVSNNLQEKNDVTSNMSNRLSFWKKICREWIRIKCNLKRKRKSNQKIRIIYEG